LDGATITIMAFDPATPPSLGHELGVDPKTIRRWLRSQGWRAEVEKGQPWLLDEIQERAVRARFAPTAVVAAPRFSARELSVRELLEAYSAILAELRRRSLARTNNAPIGDLAEYAAALAYSGLLAPNSEKSFDLTAADGRRIQVKVRNVRDDTRPSSVFSPIRSFEFEACLFMLVDEPRNEVSAAFEWSTHEVREHGTHRDHTNGTVVRVRQIRSGRIGIDRTDELRRAWETMLSLTE
jgi:hypothetical protein